MVNIFKKNIKKTKVAFQFSAWLINIVKIEHVSHKQEDTPVYFVSSSRSVRIINLQKCIYRKFDRTGMEK
jgi:hypothetical protein